MRALDATLVSALRGETRKPVSDARIDEVEHALGIPLTDELRAFYRLTDGMRLQRLRLEIFSLDRMLEHHRGWKKVWGIPSAFAYLPFALCAASSDLLCVIGATPLRGKLALVLHDDGPALVYPTVGTMLDAIAGAKDIDDGSVDDDERDLTGPVDDDDDWDFHDDSFGWYRAHPDAVGPEDDACARRVFELYLEAYRGTFDVTAGHALAFAIQLVSTSVELLEAALETDEWVASAAWHRLHALKARRARETLQRIQRERRELLDRALDAARAQGYAVEWISTDRHPEEHDIGVGLTFGGTDIPEPRFHWLWLQRREPDVVDRWMAFVNDRRKRLERRADR